MLLINLRDGNAFITDKFEVRDGRFFLDGGIVIEMKDVATIEAFTEEGV